MFHSTIKRSLLLRAFSYGEVSATEDIHAVPLHKGTAYLHLTMRKTISGSIVACWAKVSRNQTSDSAETVDLVALDLAYYSILPKYNMSPPLRILQKDNVVVVFHRNLPKAETTEEPNYCRLLLLFRSIRDAADLVSTLSGLPGLNAVGYNSRNAGGSDGTLRQGHTQAVLEELRMLSPDTLQLTNQSFRPALIEDGRSAVVQSGIEPASAMSAHSRPRMATHSSILDRPGDAAHTPAIPSIYAMTDEELGQAVARVVREEGFAEFVERIRAMST
ncbi:hypothetical protein CALVIDRAFT_563075 [Calocera viscosa TUFC12733]|uniref:Uncharacterized protein n=1 Tax=Calocera viscosa (strain TUFC12733) TaxID=1330018 RepID=A0A167N2I9_CALVF|nr:hypothetical protein CALVIDRAFT_563075 [Calocera viscosa TUFC12733]